MGKHERFFELGVEAVRRVRPAFAGQYLCPMCLRPYGREALERRVLTLEHVPPEKLGGSALVLTCTTCNSSAGTRLDSQADHLDRIRRFGTPNAVPIRSVHRIGESEERGEATFDGTTVHLHPIAKQNDPRRANDLDGRFAANKDPIEISFSVKIDFERAWLAWMRAAYLVAFAALGYTYIGNPEFDELRHAFIGAANPEFRLTAGLDLGLDPTMQSLILVEEPAALRFMLVVIVRQHLVLLPPPDGDRDFFERASALIDGDPLTIDQGVEIPWPRQPEFALDFR